MSKVWGTFPKLKPVISQNKAFEKNNKDQKIKF